MRQLRLQSTCVAQATALEHDHRWLIQTIDEACASLDDAGSRNSIIDVLGALYVRTCAHFALEEKVLREQQPDVYSAQKARDEALLERIRTMMDAYDDGECDGCEKSLDECLGSWLHEHLAEEHGHRQARLN